MSKVELFKFDEWQILAVDENVVAENHTLGAATVIDALYYNVNDAGIQEYTVVEASPEAEELLEDQGTEEALAQIRLSFEEEEEVDVAEVGILDAKVPLSC